MNRFAKPSRIVERLNQTISRNSSATFGRWVRGLLIVWTAVCCWDSSAFADEKADREKREREAYRRRLLFGEPPEYFEKYIKQMVEGIKQAKTVTVYEGLPHQFWEEETLEKELKKKTVKHHDFHFYEGAIKLKDEDATKLTDLCREAKSFGRYRGEKLCGGYHPDWCIEFKNAQDAYQVLVCFSCHEARLYGPKNDVYSDLNDETTKAFKEVLTPLRKNRPKQELKFK